MKIVLTGSNGFLGSVIFQELKMEHELITLGRSNDVTIHCDLSKTIPELPVVDMVIHNAGLAHRIPKTEAEKQAFFNVNEQGTINLLKGLLQHKQLPKTIVFISTVAVYGREEGNLLTEDIMLDGDTPYALSKIKAEEAILRFGKEHHVSIVILRLPLVVGQHPPGNLGAMIKGIQKGWYFRIGKGETKRSMVLAQDIAELLPRLIGKQGIYNLTDGIHPSFFELENKIAQQFEKKIKALPISLLHMGAKLGDIIPILPLNSYRLKKLTSNLTFSDKKARTELGWNPKPVLNADFL